MSPRPPRSTRTATLFPDPTLFRSIGTGFFVTKARRDLEIAIEARNHKELLEHLRRLRQRVEFTRMHAAGHQIVTRALRRAGRQDRRLKFSEALLDHALP